jgi:hypothetical protein
MITAILSFSPPFLSFGILKTAKVAVFMILTLLLLTVIGETANDA